MLLTKEVTVNPSGKMIQYYRNLGYNTKYHEPLIVDVDDLPKGSGEIVEILCDCCKETIVKIMYKDYIRRIEKYGNSVCYKCKPIKTRENNLKKYGVVSTTMLPEIQEKIKNTTFQNWGVEWSLQNSEVRQKAIETCRSHYDVDFSIQSKEVFNKTKKSLFEHYGVPNPAQSPEVREKMSQTLYANSSQKASKQQRYINNLYRGVLNFPVKYYNVDIYLPEDNLTIEYDGGFHLGNIITGRETMEEHNQKEIIRNNIIKREGYKQMRIISSKDLLPSDTILLQMLQDARNYFSQYPNRSWIEFSIDSSTVRNAENPQGLSYSFGELRTIKESDIKNVEDNNINNNNFNNN